MKKQNTGYMQNNPDFFSKTKFLIKDIFPEEIIKYISGLISFFIICFSLMSFTNTSEKGNLKNKKIALKSNFFSNINSQNTGFIPLNSQVVFFAEKYINQQAFSYNKMKNWGKKYFNLFDKILTKNHLPLELKYLAVVESDLQANLVSDAGASGPWQLMPDEAQKFHLKVTENKDERMDFVKSTQVACNLLKNLHKQFGDWLLAIAAYNCGANRMKQAIAKAGSDNFWKLQYFLPKETRNHVKKYIATDFYFEKSGGFTTMTADEIESYLSFQNTKNTDTLN